MKINNIINHFKTVCKHKYYVGKYCFMAGIPWRGIKHDMSKFSPTEFIESVEYYQGNRSPIDACKEANGYSKAWMHHKGRNSHHFEYWIDNLDNGGSPLKMPFKDVCELICDYLGAGRAYMDKNFSFKNEYDWWCAKGKNNLVMHHHTKEFVNRVLYRLTLIDNPKLVLNKKSLKHLYDYAEVLSNLYD